MPTNYSRFSDLPPCLKFVFALNGATTLSAQKKISWKVDSIVKVWANWKYSIFYIEWRVIWTLLHLYLHTQIQKYVKNYLFWICIANCVKRLIGITKENLSFICCIVYYLVQIYFGKNNKHGLYWTEKRPIVVTYALKVT